MIEATPATVMQALGMGGFEKILGGLRKSGVSKEAANTATRGVMAALKQLGVSTIQEVPEEIVTEIGHNLHTGLSNVDPSLLTAEKMFDTALNTTAQTVMTMGIVNARNLARGAAQSSSDAKFRHDLGRAKDILFGLKDKPLEEQLNTAFGKDKVKPVRSEEEMVAGVPPSRYSVDVGLGHQIEVEVSPVPKPTTPEEMARHLDSVRNEHFGDASMMEVLDNPQVALEDKFERAWAQYPATGGWVTLPNGAQTDVAGLIKLANPQPGMVFNHETIHGALRLFTTDKEFETVTEAAKRNGAFSEEGLVNTLLLRGALEQGKATDKGVLGILNRATMRMKGFVKKLYGGEKSFDEIARELFEGTITQREVVANPATRNARLREMEGYTPQAAQAPAAPQATPQGPTLSEEIAAAQRAEMMGEGPGIPPAGPIVTGPDMRMPQMVQGARAQGPVTQEVIPEPVTQGVTFARRPVAELAESLPTAIQQHVPPAFQEQVHGLVTGALTERDGYLNDLQDVVKELEGDWGLTWNPEVEPHAVKGLDTNGNWTKGGLGRIVEKLQQGRVPTDVLRSTIMLPQDMALRSAEYIQRIREAMEARGYEVYLKNGKEDIDNRFRRQTPEHYRDLAFKFTKNGVTRELQLLQKYMYQVKNGKGHKFLEILQGRDGKEITDGDLFETQDASTRENMDAFHLDNPSIFGGISPSSINNAVPSAAPLRSEFVEYPTGNPNQSDLSLTSSSNVYPAKPLATSSSDVGNVRSDISTTSTKSIPYPGAVQSSSERVLTAKEETTRRRRWEAVTPRGDVRVSGEYQIVDAGTLITSNMEGYDQSLQARNRDTVTSQAQIKSIAGNPDPTRLMDSPTTDLGAPLVDESGQVISGNGRTMGLREAYATGRAEAYRKAVEAKARRHGLSTEGIQNPVLVRVMRDTGGASVKQVADLSNQNQILQMTTAEQAQADAEAIGPFIELFQTDEAGNIRAASNRSFLTNFVQATHSDNLLNSDGSFSPEIDSRVKRAMLARVFKNSEAGRRAVQNVFENAEALGMKRVLDGVTQAAGRLVSVSDMKKQLDLTPDLGKALHEYAVFRQKVADGEVKLLDEYLGQGDMFQEGRDPLVDTLIRELDSRGRRSATALFSLLDRYGKLAEKVDLDTPDMFTGEVDRTTPQELLNRARQELETESAERTAERANARREGRVSGASQQNARTGENVARPENAPAGEGDNTNAQGPVGDTQYSTKGLDKGILFSTAKPDLSRTTFTQDRRGFWEGTLFMDDGKPWGIARGITIEEAEQDAQWASKNISSERAYRAKERYEDKLREPERAATRRAQQRYVEAGRQSLEEQRRFSRENIPPREATDARYERASKAKIKRPLDADMTPLKAAKYAFDRASVEAGLARKDYMDFWERQPVKFGHGTDAMEERRLHYEAKQDEAWERYKEELKKAGKWDVADIKYSTAMSRDPIQNVTYTSPSMDDKQAQSIISKVVRYFRTTGDYREAGYVTPDGRMLDLSGKRQGGMPGVRYMDHREVPDLGGTERTDDMLTAIDAGLARVDFNVGMVNISRPMNIKQKAVILRGMENGNPSAIRVEVLDGKTHDTVYNADMDGDNTTAFRRALNEAESVMRGERKPEYVRFSTANIDTPEFKQWFGDWKISRQNQVVNDQIRQWAKGKLPSNVIIEIGEPSDILKKYGVPNLPITLTQSVLRKSAVDKHGLGVDMLEDISLYIQYPIAVFDDPDFKETRIVITEIRHKDGNVTAAIRMNVERDGLEVNDIRSIHPKRDENIQRWIRNGLLLGIEKDKGRKWLENSAPTNPGQPQVTATLDNLIIHENPDFVNTSKVVDKNGKPLRVYHGTDATFYAFDKNKTSDSLFWFTSDRNKIASGESGAAGRSKIAPFYLSAKKLAGWEEYDKYSIDELIQQGYDGIKLDDDYVVFSPEQIKSADETTYDDQGKPIPQSERYSGSPDTRYSTANLDSLSQPQRDRYTDAEFAAMYQYGSDEEAYREALRSQFGAQIDPYVDDLREMYLSRRREGIKRAQAAAMQGEEPVGRPDLANFGETPEAKKMLSQTDEARNEAGKPDHIPRDVTRDKAEAMIEQDREGTIAALMAKGMRQEPLTPEETRAGTILFNELAQEAIDSGDLKAHERAQEFADALRESRGAWGRAGVEMQVPKTPEEKANMLLQYAMSPSHNLQAKIDKTNRRLKDKMATGAASAAAEKRMAVLRGKQAKQVQKRLDWLKRLGYDLTPKGLDAILGNEKLLARFMADVSTDRSSLADKAHELRISNMLSWVTTHQRNILSAVVHQALDTYVQRALEATVNSLPIIGGHADAAQFGEFGPI